MIATTMLLLAAELPVILGTIPNRDQAKITFTTTEGNCKDGEKLVYTQADGGKVTLTGCYRIVGDQLFVVWRDGDIYTYDFASLELSGEMQRYIEERKR